jgi:cholesterol oxidase
MSEEHFDVVVVGSGFGGSVMAYRMAEAGRRVCVLERGKPYPPGSFPRSPYRMRTNFWDPTQGLYGLFDFWSFSGLDVLVASGLGGGSLIYANVLLRKDERWFVKEDPYAGVYEHWPVSRADLDPHYDRVEAMLRPQQYPFELPPYDAAAKTRAFREAAERAGLRWFAPPLAVTFANPGEPPVPGEPIREGHPNLHGRTRHTCRLCGECDVGCNYGSKNTMDYTYLSAAVRLGAEIRTGADVRAFSPRQKGGYAIRYIHYAPDSDGRPTAILDPATPMRTVTADRLVLAAGSLGSTRLILRNRSAVPHISRRLGTRFCGNGDLLTFALRCRDESGGRRVIDPGYGPVITTALRVEDAADGGAGRGFYLEDGGFPAIVAWLLQASEVPRDLWRWRSVVLRLTRERLRRDRYRHTGRSAAVAQLLGASELSAGVLPIVAMGRDVPDGRMYLRHNHLCVDWRKDRGGASGPYFERVRETCRRLAEALDGDFRDNPLWFLRRVITVHPLGGCPMGRDAGEGVVDSYGEVFGCPGLYIADGSVMPGPVGPNPSLTIAALADRFADRLVEQ